MHALAASCEELRARTGNPPLDGNVIKQVDKAKSLGLIIDKNLSWSNHIDMKCKKFLPL